MEPLDTIRKNLLEASANARHIFPAPPMGLMNEIQTAWNRYADLAEMESKRAILPGKSPMRKSEESFGFIWFVVGGLAALAALAGGGAILQHELTQSELLKKISQCLREMTSKGYSPSEANKICNERFGTGAKPLISIGEGFNPTTILTVGGIGLLLFFLLGKGFK